MSRSPPSISLKKEDESAKLPSSASAVSSDDTVGAEKTKPKRRSRRPSSHRRPRDMPSRPLTAYNFFFRHQRSLMVAERESQEDSSRMKGAELFSAMGKAVAERWKSLSPEQVAEYQAFAREDKKRYSSEMEEYNRRAMQKMTREWRGASPPSDSQQEAGDKPSHETSKQPPAEKDAAMLPSGSHQPGTSHDEGAGGLGREMTAQSAFQAAVQAPSAASFASAPAAPANPETSAADGLRLLERLLSSLPAAALPQPPVAPVEETPQSSTRPVFAALLAAAVANAEANQARPPAQSNHTYNTQGSIAPVQPSLLNTTGGQNPLRQYLPASQDTAPLSPTSRILRDVLLQVQQDRIEKRLQEILFPTSNNGSQGPGNPG